MQPCRRTSPHDPDHRLWVLSGPAPSYVLHLDDEDRLRGLHRRPRLTPEQAASLLERPLPRRQFEHPADGLLALDTAGAMRYGHAAVQVRFADGVHDLELSWTGETRTDHELVLTFADRHYPLTAEAHFRVHADTDVLERHLVLRHTGTELPYGETVLSSRRGTTGHHANPWVMLDDGTASEEHGRVHSCALAWSGSWQLTVQRLPTERVAVSAGAGHAPITTRLSPGTELRTPVSAAAYTEGGFGGASRAWHRYLLGHVLPHPGELRPVLYNSWEATEFDVSVEGQSALAERAAALGVELFVMDDGWFGARTHDAAGLGDWTPNPARFPDGLAPLIDRVHELGMRFGLWVEPEMVNPDSDLYRTHPDGVLHHPTRRRTEARNQLVLNLARPDVAAWMYDRLDELLTNNDIDLLKWTSTAPSRKPVGPTPRATPKPCGPTTCTTSTPSSTGCAPPTRTCASSPAAAAAPDSTPASWPAPTRCGPPTTPTPSTAWTSSTASVSSTRPG
ncbi:Alpha-galactosidase [Actinobacteria bacterium OK074]|nr:Alpha-galactosidase [Actinobacteria bacterium OK074]